MYYTTKAILASQGIEILGVHTWSDGEKQVETLDRAGLYPVHNIHKVKTVEGRECFLCGGAWCPIEE